MGSTKNRLLVEFEFVIDLDLAILKMMKEEYKNSSFIIDRLRSFNNEYRMIEMMIHRDNSNPLTALIVDGYDTSKLYDQIINEKEQLLLDKYAKPADSFGLMVTYLTHSYSAVVTILCRNSIEEQFIKSKNANMPTLVSSKADVNLDEYDVLYVKYADHLQDYGAISGKNIYIAKTKYNCEGDASIHSNVELLSNYAFSNIFHLIDIYKYVKYSPKGEEGND